MRCKTKYPVILVHGIALRDYKHIKYWGKIPDILKEHGAEIFFGEQDAWGTIEHNAAAVKKNILKVLNENDVDKVNIIAHSKGGLDMRYMISHLDMAKHVASLTTISTPHYGSKSMDVAFKMPTQFHKFFAYFANIYFKIAGDKNPDFYKSCNQLRTDNIKKFNEEVLDEESIYYQSYGSVMKYVSSDPKFSFTYPIIKHIEGDNDGIVALNSTKWGEFKGLIDEEFGGSHADIIGFRFINISKSDIKEFYVSLVEELKIKGF